MNIFLKMEGIPTKYATFVLVISLLATFTESKITRLNVIEGGVAVLNFSYSCNSTEVTLQRANGAPFYNSRSPTPPSSSNLNLRNETDGESCFLYLTFNPVTRDDAGGYILTAYKDDPIQYEDERILLLVRYPPGRASCSLSEEHMYIDQDWVRLLCTAPVGSIGGFIMCYQNGTKIPRLNSPQQHDETVSQTLLAKVWHLVYCCSSTLDQTKDRCECKDSVWDPIHNKQVISVSDPCPPTVTAVQYPPYSQHPTEDSEFESTSPANTKCTFQHIDVMLALASFFMCVSILLLVSNCIRHCRMRRRHSRKRPNLGTENRVEGSFTSDDKLEKL